MSQLADRARGAVTADAGRSLIETAFLLVYTCATIWPDEMPARAPSTDVMLPLLEPVFNPHD